MADPDRLLSRQAESPAPTAQAGLHAFSAIAFVENLPLKEFAAVFPGSRMSPHELHRELETGGDFFAYPFGAMVFHNAAPAEREAALSRLRARHPELTNETVREDFLVREASGARVGIAEGTLVIDRLTQARVSAVALVVAQSAAMEYYERIVDQLFGRTRALVDRLQTRGSVSMRTRALHRFIGEAIGIRTEVLSVLHLLDRPDATWEDPAMDRIYGDLQEEFDLLDRYQALEQELRAIQEALELVLGVARDRRLVLLEAAIVVLILFEILVNLIGLR
jgi:uncharacterized Rmd1/YagE family protein